MIVSELNVYRNKLGNSDVKQGLFSFPFYQQQVLQVKTL